MRLRPWSERAREAPDAPALLSTERTVSYAELLGAICRTSPSNAPRAVLGECSVVGVLELIGAIDRGAPALLLHPRWTARERDAALAQLDAIDTRLEGDARTLAVVHTSGTSGTPRGAVLSRRAFIAAARASAEHLGRAPADRWLLSMPLAHVGGLGVLVRSLVYESPLVLMEGAFDPVRLLDLAERFHVTHVSLVPTMLARILDVLGERRWPPSISTVLLGGAACPASILSRARAAGLPILPTYGLTETCGQVATRRGADEGLAPLPGTEVRVVEGTLRVRSPSLFDGWLGDPRSALDAEGFYDTGDLGAFDDAHVQILARRSDLIVSGGENVYPREVEDALERIPGVRSACVFGVPDVSWGERVAAAIVLVGPLEPRALERALRADLAPFKIPRLLAELEELPLGVTGKVDRRSVASRALPFLRPFTAG